MSLLFRFGFFFSFFFFTRESVNREGQMGDTLTTFTLPKAGSLPFEYQHLASPPTCQHAPSFLHASLRFFDSTSPTLPHLQTTQNNTPYARPQNIVQIAMGASLPLRPDW